jgi:hypothetical protein
LGCLFCLLCSSLCCLLCSSFVAACCSRRCASACAVATFLFCSILLRVYHISPYIKFLISLIPLVSLFNLKQKLFFQFFCNLCIQVKRTI